MVLYDRPKKLILDEKMVEAFIENVNELDDW